MTMNLDDQIAELARTVPSQFVAERTRRVKLLKEAGEHAAAKRLGELRKLSTTDWALNVAAADDATVVDSFCEAAATLAASQEAAAESRPPAVELRIATRALRVATAAVADVATAAAAAHGLTGAGSTPVEITTRLLELAPDPTGLAALRAGVVGMPATEPSSDMAIARDVEGMDEPAPAGAPSKRRRRPAGDADATTAGAAASADDAGRQLAVVPAGELLAAGRAHRELLAAARRQQREVRQAERAVEEITRVVRLAADRLAEAEARLAAAEAARDEARRRADELGAAVADSAARRLAEPPRER